MDDSIQDALVNLKTSIDKQNQIQEDANDVMRALIGTLRETAQEMADLREAMANKNPDGPRTKAWR